MHVMFRLNAKEGNFYVGDIEVDASQVFMGLETKVGFEGDRLPALEPILFNILRDMKRDRNRDLFEANAYRAVMIDARRKPEMQVMDGKVPADNKVTFLIDLYNVRPKEY